MDQPRLAAVLYGKLDEPPVDVAASVRHEVSRREELLLSRTTEEWNGVLVKRLGNGVLARFDSVRNAVSAAVEMQQLLVNERQRAERASVQHAVGGGVRIGVAVGEIVTALGGADADDVIGVAVVEAARLAGHAPPRTILGMPHVPHAIYPDDGLAFADGPEVQFKGFDRPTTPCLIEWAALPDLAEQLAVPAALRVPPTGTLGREEVVGQMLRWFERSVTEGPVLLSLVGPAGIGKTTVVAEAVTRMRRSGAGILFGRCRTEAGVPYLAFSEALNDLIERHPRPDRLFGPYRAELGAVLRPQEARSMFDAEGDAAARRARVFRAAGDLLRDLGAELPVVLVLDDVQWADRATVDLLRQVTTTLEGTPLLVVCTARADEIDANPALVELFADLARTLPGDRIRVDGLDDTTVEELLAASSVGGAAAMAAEVRRRTGGNPFFITELVAGGLDASNADEVPWRVQELIQSRLARVGDAGRTVLTVAAVAGRSFDPMLVAECSGVDADQAVDLLDDAVRSGLLLEEHRQGLTMVFDHDLIRETLLADLSRLRLARLHASLGAAIEERHLRRTGGVAGAGSVDGADLAELARHFGAAAALGDNERAFRYNLLAGEHGLQTDANDLALDWFRTSASFAATPGDRVGAAIGEGRALRRLGRPEARSVLLGAAEMARTIADAELMGRALLADYRGTFGVALHVDEPRVDALRAALDLAGPEQSVLRADLLSSLAVELVWAPNWQESTELADEALAIARRIGDPELTMRVLSLRQWVLYHPLDRRIAETEELRALVDAHGDPNRRFDAASHASFTYLCAGDAASTRQSIELASYLAARIDQPLVEWMLAQRLGCLAMLEARFDDAAGLIARSAELGRQTAQPDAVPQQIVQQFWLSYEVSPVEAQVRELRATVAGLDFAPPYSWPAIGYRCLELGLHDAAADVYERLVDRGIDSMPRDQIWLWNLCQVAAIAAVHDLTRAPSLIHELEPHRRELATMNFASAGPVARYLGLLHASLGADGEAEADLLLAIDRATEMSAPSWEARARLDLADLHDRLGRRDDATGSRAHAAAIADRHGLPLVASRAARML